MNKLKKISPALLVAVLLLLPIVAFGVIQTPRSPVTGGLTKADVESIINSIANFILTIGVIMAVISVAVGGIYYAIAGGDEKKVELGRAWLKHGLIAALIIFGVGVLVDTMKNIVARQFF